MKRIVFLFVAILSWMAVFAQSPQSFKYQAVARDVSGGILANKAVTFKISVLQGSLTGTPVYSELHAATTNAFGLVELVIGKGTSPSGIFSGIAWGSNLYFLKTEMDPAGGIAFQHMGTSQMLSVPYALHAKTVETESDGDPANEIQTISVSGSNLTLSKGGGTVPMPGNDNWGGQSVVTDATLSGTGLTANPLKIPDGAVTSAKILNGTITTADLANDAVTVDKISNSGALTGQVLTYTGSNVAWSYAEGSIIKISVINSGCFSVASFGSTSYVKIADLGSFVKQDANSWMEVTFEGRIWAQTMNGTGAHFELRIDNVATSNGRARANLKSAQIGGVGEYVSITGIFTGLTIGTHTISMWIIGAGGSGTNGGVDPGCWSDDRIIAREIK